jgi:hypothetical protein
VTTHLYSGETIGAWAYEISSTWVYSGTCLSVGRIVDFITAVDLVEIYYCQWILVDLHAKSVLLYLCLIQSTYWAPKLLVSDTTLILSYEASFVSLCTISLVSFTLFIDSSIL